MSGHFHLMYLLICSAFYLSCCYLFSVCLIYFYFLFFRFIFPSFPPFFWISYLYDSTLSCHLLIGYNSLRIRDKSSLATVLLPAAVEPFVCCHQQGACISPTWLQMPVLCSSPCGTLLGSPSCLSPWLTALSHRRETFPPPQPPFPSQALETLSRW